MITTFVLAAVASCAFSAPETPVDLTKIDRSVSKEPVYQSKSPKYGLLVFGPKAETRVWVVLDVVSEPTEPDGGKNALYVDRNGNGDLTEPGERIACTMQEQEGLRVSFSPKTYSTFAPHFDVGEIVERDGTRHADLMLEVGDYVRGYRPCSLSINVRGWGKQSAGGWLLEFADRPQDAPIIHFNGPLTLRLFMTNGSMRVPINYDEEKLDESQRRRWYVEHPPEYIEEKLVRGKSASLRAQLGTPGLGRGTFVSLSAGAAPEGVHPVAEIAFPVSDPRRPPIAARVVLKERC